MKKDRLRRLFVLCGPNGAGKSTFYEMKFKDTGVRFVNADEIAKGLKEKGGVNKDYKAAELAEEERRRLMSLGESFIMETVLSDPKGEKLGFFKEAQTHGYQVTAFYIGLASPEVSRAHVMQRVKVGGHDVPDEKIDARFPRTLANLKRLLDIADELWIYDNSTIERPFRKLAILRKGRLTECVEEMPRWTAGLELEKRRTQTTKMMEEKS